MCSSDLVLVDALAALHSHGASPNWRWVLAGDGPFARTLARRIEDAGIRDRVVLAGRVDDATLHAWYEAATVFVHPSRYEGSSLVTLEAMAHRRAIIASRAGGLPDKVRPGVNGWLVDVDSVDGLAEAISEAASKWSALPAMGEAGRRIVERDFSWAVLVERYLTMYEELRAKHSPGLKTGPPKES